MLRLSNSRANLKTPGQHLAITLAGVTIGAFGASASKVQAVPLPDRTLPQPFGVQLKAPNNSAENLDKIQALGLKMVRRGFIWEAIEKTPGVYDFSLYDRLIRDCRERGLTIIGCMAFSNKLYGHVREDKGRAGYARFAAALAERYKGENILWEIWNEPNTQTFWGKHGKHNSEPYADEYVALVKATVPAMKKADPNCTVLGGSVSGLWSASFQWMDFCFQKGVLKSGIDVWSVHPYSTKNPEDYVEAYAMMRASMAKNGGPENIPVINSERGFPLGKAEGAAGGDPALSREYQAWHLVRQYLIDQLCDIRATIWYEWSGKEGFSLYDAQEELPAFKACRVLVEQLSGCRFDKRIALASPRDFALRFVSQSGGVKIVAWTSPPPGESPDKTPSHSVTIPIEADGALEAFDLYGAKSMVVAKNGAFELALSGAPQYITVQAGK